MKDPESGRVRVGLALPVTYWADEEWKNLDAALAYVDEAAESGVSFLLFPEGYPGPMTGSLHPKELRVHPIDALRERARKHGMYIAAGDVEDNPAIPDTYFLTLKLISPKGEILANYSRMQPDTPPLNAYLYNGKAHLLPGKEFKVVRTEVGNIGLQICSELFVPEICRINMLRGTEILVSPVHGLHSKTMYNPARVRDTWRCVARARAAENLYYVMVTQNIYQMKNAKASLQVMSGAFVAGPESMIASRETPGLLVAELDMGRLAYLRGRNYDEENLSRPDPNVPVEPLGCRPGQIWERNPQLYAELAEPHRFSFDYGYYAKNIDSWVDEYQKLYSDKYSEIQRKRGKLRFE